MDRIVTRSPVLHVGFPKCASTYLETLMSAHPGVQVERMRIPNVERPRASVTIPAGDGVCLAINEKVALGEIAESAAAIRNSEIFELGANPDVHFDPGEMAKRLGVMYPEARVLMVFREQTAWLDSAYRYYLPRLPGNRRSFESFCSTARGAVYRQVACYEEAIQAYGDVFGWQNLCVARFEVLRRDRDAFVAGICGFLGVAPVVAPTEIVNPSSPPWATRLRRHFPVLEWGPAGLRRSAVSLAGRLATGDSSSLSAEEISRIESAYAASKRKTQSLIDRIKNSGGTVVA